MNSEFEQIKRTWGSTSNQPTSHSVSITELDYQRTRAEAKNFMDVTDVFENSENDADQSNPFQVVQRKKA